MSFEYFRISYKIYLKKLFEILWVLRAVKEAKNKFVAEVDAILRSKVHLH